MISSRISPFEQEKRFSIIFVEIPVFPLNDSEFVEQYHVVHWCYFEDFETSYAHMMFVNNFLGMKTKERLL